MTKNSFLVVVTFKCILKCKKQLNIFNIKNQILACQWLWYSNTEHKQEQPLKQMV